MLNSFNIIVITVLFLATCFFHVPTMSPQLDTNLLRHNETKLEKSSCVFHVLIVL